MEELLDDTVPDEDKLGIFVKCSHVAYRSKNYRKIKLKVYRKRQFEDIKSPPSISHVEMWLVPELWRG